MGVAKGDYDLGVALMVLLMGTCILYLPLILPRLISGVDVEAWRVAQPLIMMILVPFIVGLLLKVRYPGVAARLEPPLDQFSSVCLIVVIVVVVALYRQSLISAVGEGAIGACMLFLALSMAAGYLLGGPDVGTRRVLALGSGQRNIEAMLLIAHQLEQLGNGSLTAHRRPCVASRRKGLRVRWCSCSIESTGAST